MKQALQTIADQVCDERSFINFIQVLAKDRADEIEKEKEKSRSTYEPGCNGWENGTIESFLEAASAWADTSFDGLPLYKKPENPWTRCAHILLMGKIYE